MGDRVQSGVLRTSVGKGPGALPVLPRALEGPVTPGAPNTQHAARIIEIIAEGVGLAVSGDAAALCTAPIHKKALQDGAGFAYPGHTEYLGALAGGVTPVMMLASDTLRVVPVTIHTPLSRVPGAPEACIGREFALVGGRVLDADTAMWLAGRPIQDALLGQCPLGALAQAAWAGAGRLPDRTRVDWIAPA